MLPSKFYKHFGVRIKLTKYAGGTYYQWDPGEQQLIFASPYLLFGMWAGLFGAILLIFIHCLQIYLKINLSDIPEEEEDLFENYAQKSTRLRKYATLIIQIGEVILVTCVTFLNYVFLRRLDIFKYLLNQLLNYNKHLTSLIEDGHLVLTTNQQKITRTATVLMYLVIIISTLLPFGVLIAFSSEIEPNHQLVEEWLEIPVKLSWGTLPLMFLIYGGTYGTGTSVGLMCMLICLYFPTATICTESITPTQVERNPTDGAGRFKIETRGYGLKTDFDVMQLYRTQQIFNALLSSFFRSVLISFHHIGLLATLVTLVVFTIKYNGILSESGVMGYLIVFWCISAVLMVIYFQCKMGGEVVDISTSFKTSGSILFPRKSLFRKFSRSCKIFYIEVTYPFYTIDQETFTSFIAQVLDYSIQLLLW